MPPLPILCFWIAGAMTLLGAVGAVRAARPFDSVICLGVFFCALGALFALLESTLLGLAEVLLGTGSAGMALLLTAARSDLSRGPRMSLRTWVVDQLKRRGAIRRRADAKGWVGGMMAAAGLLFVILLPAATGSILPIDPLVPEIDDSWSSFFLALTDAYGLSLLFLGLLIVGAFVTIAQVRGAVTEPPAVAKN